MVYNGERNQVSQAVTDGSTVVFQTVNANVELLDSTGAGLEGGAASYYAGGWHTFGTTDASGNAYQEMLPSSYSFAMVYNGEHQQLNGQDVSGPIVFQTTGVTVQIQRSTGANPPLSGGTASYYAGGWHTIGTTDDNGQMTIEMLPGNYSFAMVFNDTREQMNAVAISGTTTNVEFLTTQVHSDSGTATSYYAGGWQPFTQDMYLLPGNYAFHFNDSTPQTQEVLTGGTTSHIH